MIHSLLIARLRPALDRQRTLRRQCWLSGLLVVGAAALFLAGPAARPWVVTALVAGAAVLWFATWLVDGEPRELARRLEKRHPDLDGRLATAVEQEPDAAGRFSFLQERLIEEALRHSTEREWAQVIPARSLHGARAAMLLAAVLFAGAWVSTRSAQLPASELATQPASAEDVTVQPGDVELERGSALVVMAKFDRDVPVAADLVTGDAAASEKRVPLTKNLSDPVFGGSVPDVQQSFSYRVEHDGRRTRDFRVTVFEYPRLERSDLTLTFPGYTKLEPRRLEDSRRASAVEGTRLDAELQLNKPVASALLKPKEAKGMPLTLEVSADKAVARLRGHVPVASATYDLVLTDADGRTNKKPAVFSFDVLPNRTPELKLTSPRGDQRPSALQELAFDGTAWDDFGVLAYGLAIARPAAEPEYIELGRGVAAREKQPFHHLLKFEDMKAQPDDLYSWFVWADDLGPDGKVRRTTGDLFFGEIRPFEEIFRQGEAMGAQDQQQQEQQQGQQGQGNQVAQLAELQKQIMVATWKLQRASTTDSAEKTKADAAVVLESQQQAKSQAEEAAAQGGGSPQAAGQWKAVTDAMDQAIASLGKVPEDFKELAVAQGHEQTAYQTLLRLRAREKEVAMQQQQQQQGGQQGQNSGQQQERQQLEQLDLAKDENRYEQERQAQNPQSAERREQAQVINRLQELAKRQQDVNEKLQELQTALQEAKTEEEREEARRQLKRLEEEQRQMVADADELRQRMERPENQSRMEEQRQQLDQARDAMQQAAEAAQEGQTGQALAAGTRAERQMQEMREQLRQQSSSQFAEDLKNMRAEARDLAQQQEKLARELAGGTEEGATPQRKSLGDDAAADPKQAQLERQQQRTAELVKQATALSEEAEAAEPLLSRQLYDAARQFSQEDAGAVKEMQQQMLKEGELTERMFMDMKEIMEAEDSGRTQELAQQFLEQNNADKAADAAQRGRAAMDSLRQGVEKAAESVLGDDTAALEFAEAQLKAAADALRNEMAAEGQGGDPAGNESTAQNTRRPGEAGREPGEPGEDEEERTPRPGRGERGAGETAQNDQAEPQGGGGGEPGEENQQQNGNPRSGRGQRGAGEVAQNEGNQGEEPGRETAENSRPQRGQRGQGEQPGEGEGGGRSEGEGQELQTAQNESAQRDGGQQRGSGGGRSGVAQNREGNPNSRGGGSGGGVERGLTLPLTSEGFIDWSDRLRDVEELVDFPELRNEVATARERARTVRLEARRELKKPDWAVVELQILKPLVEVQQRLREELARRSPEKALVPIDRDPVPAQYSDAVRHYYEQLGAVK